VANVFIGFNVGVGLVPARIFEKGGEKTGRASLEGTVGDKPRPYKT